MKELHIQYWKRNLDHTTADITDKMRGMVIPEGDPQETSGGFSDVYYGSYDLRFYKDDVQFDAVSNGAHSEPYMIVEHGYAIQFCKHYRVDIWTTHGKYSLDARGRHTFFIPSRMPFLNNPPSLDVPVSVVLIDFHTVAKNGDNHHFPHRVHDYYKVHGSWPEGIILI